MEISKFGKVLGFAGLGLTWAAYAGDKVTVSASEDTKATVKIWQQPKDLGAQDLSYGMGKKDKRPMPKLDEATGFYYFNFVDSEAETPPKEAEECGTGAFPKIAVEDSNGKNWKMKFVGAGSSKVHSEVAANYLAHGLGFMAHEIYYSGPAAYADVKGMDQLKALYVKGYHHPRGCSGKIRSQLQQDKAHPEFWRYTEATLTKKSPKEQVGEHKFRYDDADLPKSKEFSALKLFQVLIANWDVHGVSDDYYNNAVFYVAQEDADGKPKKDVAGDVLYDKWYWQKDVGASFGQLEPERNRPLERLTWNFSPDKFLTRWDPGPYSRYHIVAGFDKAKGLMRFHYSAHEVPLKGNHQPFISKAAQAAFREMPIEDVRWFYDTVLSKLSDGEMDSAFKGAFGTPEDTAKIEAAFKSRISEIKKALDSVK